MNDSVVIRQGMGVMLLTALRAAGPSLLAVAVLRFLVYQYDVDFDVSFRVLSVLILVLGLLILRPTGIPTEKLESDQWPMVMELTLRWALFVVVLLLVGFVTKVSAEFSRRVIVTWALATPALLIILSVLLDSWLRGVIRNSSVPRRVVFVGYNETSQALSDRLRARPGLCMAISGFYDDRSADRLGVRPMDELKGGLRNLADVVKRDNIDLIFIALPMRHIQRVLTLLDELRDTTCSIYYVPDVFVFDLIQSRTVDIAGMPAVAMCETPFYGYRAVVKRLMDVVLASVLLICLMPVMLATSIAIKVSSRGPILFRQRRYGLDGQEITVYKFRTMRVSEDGGQIRQATPNDPRVFPAGRFLRRYSLDELPQLVNVLQGRMSLVGPRPHAVAHNEEYRKLIKGYMVRHKVLPGITGLAQVNGCRGETARLEEMQARIEYDLNYLRYWSPALDIRILFLTVWRVFRDAKAY